MVHPLANAGTPLIWFTMAHMVFGNIIIGLLEAAVLWLWLRRKSARLLWAIPINYLSAFAGLCGIGFLEAFLAPRILGDEPLLHLHLFLIVMLVLTFVASLLIEWPLYIAVLRPWLSWKRSLLPVAVAQVVSYVLLVALYASVSVWPSSRDMRPVRLAAFAPFQPATVYFISDADRAICRIRSDGTGREVITSLDTTVTWRRLQLEADGSVIQVVEVDNEGNQRVVSKMQLIDKDLPERVRLWPYMTYDWRPEHERVPEIGAGHWPADGLRVWHPSGPYRLAVETPVTWWYPGPATVLPGSQVVFGLHKWVMIFDPATRKVATLTAGHSPVAIPDEAVMRPVSQAAPAAVEGDGR
jgi:hypothetical protein